MRPKTSKVAVVFPCRGIGDGLLMMIASEALRQSGMAVTTVHPRLAELIGCSCAHFPPWLRLIGRVPSHVASQGLFLDF